MSSTRTSERIRTTRPASSQPHMRFMSVGAISASISNRDARQRLSPDGPSAAWSTRCPCSRRARTSGIQRWGSSSTSRTLQRCWRADSGRATGCRAGWREASAEHGPSAPNRAAPGCIPRAPGVGLGARTASGSGTNSEQIPTIGPGSVGRRGAGPAAVRARALTSNSPFRPRSSTSSHPRFAAAAPRVARPLGRVARNC